MNRIKRNRLEAKGWKIGSIEEFLGLTQEESAYIDLKIALTHALRFYRQSKQITQERLAKLVKSSQSRVAKMESGDPSVSIDLLIKSILALGVSAGELLRFILEQIHELPRQETRPPVVETGATDYYRFREHSDLAITGLSSGVVPSVANKQIFSPTSINKTDSIKEVING